MSKYYTINFAQAYGEGAYGACEYNDTTSCTTSGGGSTGGNNNAGSGSGQLTDTGFAIVAIVTLAAVLMLVAIVVRVWRRSANKPVAETVTAQRQDDNFLN